LSGGAFGIEGRDGAVFINIHAVPGSKREGVVGVHGGALKVAVRARPERGRANAALIEALSRVAGVGRSDVEVVAGHSSRGKRVTVRGVTVAALRARVESALGEAGRAR
jgi:uncharacterized protein (TIGR00251 family)